MRYYALTLAAVGLLLGLAGSKHIGRAITGVLSEFHLDSDFAFTAAWLVTYALCYLVLIPISRLIYYFVGWFLRNKQRRILATILDTNREVIDQLEIVNDEFFREKAYTEDSRTKLEASARKALVVIRVATDVPAVVGTRKFAQRVWCLMVAVERHAESEVRAPISKGWISAEDGIRTVNEARWGIECVKTLVNHLREEVKQHPLYLG